jgi:signal transduction histidine kinase
MNDADIRGRVATRDQEGAPWRVDAMRAMLTFGSVVAPLASLLAIILRPPPHPVLDTVVLACAGLVMPVLRLAPGLSFSWRAGITIASFFAAGIFVIARSGLAPGVSLLFAVTSIFAAMYFGRAAGYAMVGLGALSFIAIGWFVTNGLLPVPPNAFDPHRFENWFRVGVVYALIASLLTSAVTFVIGRVEASARDLRVAYERLGQLHLRLESTKEEERRFLAHELHDEFGQLLTALKLRIQLAARGAALSNAPGADTDPLVVIDDLIARVRRMSGDLRPPLLDEVGLLPAIRAYLEAQSALSGVAMALEADELREDSEMRRLGPELEITCFRIVQEAVTNALRHADARDLRVHIERRADHVALRIHDDGRGFDVGVRLEGAASAGHLGVVGMRERVRAHGGGFRMRSRPGAGTTIEVELPLPARALGAAGTAAVPS